MIKGAFYGIVFTVALGVAAISFVVSMGYYSFVTGKELAGLVASKTLVDKIKQRHIDKKADLKNKVAKKAVSRAARSTVASLVGPVLIGAVTVGFVIEDYCHDMKDLHEEDKLLGGSTGEYDSTQCITDLKKDAESWVVEARDEAKKHQSEILSEIKKKWQAMTNWLKDWWG